jgi:hypothetical protein
VEQVKVNNWLNQHKRNVTSQQGEDGIVEKIFEILPSSNQWCVEFGAGDGKELSNTFNLIANKGWSSVQIEANTSKFKTLSDRYKDNNKVTCINKIICFEGESTLDHVLKSTSIPLDLDLLLIDIDGNDYYVWQSLNIYRPKLVVIEFNPTIPNCVEFVQIKDMSVNHGNSLLALSNLGKQKGYELIATTDYNAFFIDQKYFHLFDIQDNSVSAIHQDIQYLTHVFQLYDGTIAICGNRTLLWHGLEVDFQEIQEMIQILPEELRFFPSK